MESLEPNGTDAGRTGRSSPATSLGFGQLAALGVAAFAVLVAGSIALFVAGGGGRAARTSTDAPGPIDIATLPAASEDADATGATTLVGPGSTPATPPAGGSPGASPTSTTPSSTPSAAPPDLARQLLGPLHDGQHRLVRLVPADETSDDTECPGGSLAVEDATGAVTHTYPGTYGHLEFHPGPYGQLALVERCEESIGRLLLAGTGGLDPGEPPVWVPLRRPGDLIWLERPGWLGLTGWFAADATFVDDRDPSGTTLWHDTVVIDASDGSVAPWAEALGRRESTPLLGIDYVLPDGWIWADASQDASAIHLWDDGSASWLDILVLVEPPTTPTAYEDEQLVDVTDTSVPLWTDLGDGRAARVGQLDAVDHRFESADGARTVRLITAADRTVVIEGFVAADAMVAGGEIPVLLTEAVRVLDAVG